MKRFITYGGAIVKSLMLIAVLLCATVASATDVTVTINNGDPIYVVDDQTVVPVQVDVNSGDLQLGVTQIGILLPDELEFAKDATWDESRFDYSSGQDVTWNNNVELAKGVYGGRFNTYIWGAGYGTLKNSGEFFTFYIKAKSGEAATQKSVQIQFISPLFGGVNLVDGKLPQYDNDCPESVDVNIGFHSTTTLSATETEFLINPTGTHTVTLALESNFEQGGFQFDIYGPDGFTYGNYVLNSRTKNALKQTQNNNGYTRVLVFGKGKTFDGTEGDVMTFDVTAPEGFTGEGTITIKNITTTNPDGTISASGKEFTIKVVSGGDAYNNAMAEVKKLQDALDAALATIATDYPDYVADYTGADIQTSIDNLKAAIEEAYNGMTLTDNYSSVMAPTAGIQADIDALLAAVKAKKEADDAEKARQAANDEAYNKDVQTIADIEKALQDAIDQIKKDYPDGESEEAEQAVKDAIDAAKQAVEDAKKAVENEGTYTSPINSEDLTGKITKLVEDAKAAQEAADAEKAREAANQKAYQDDLQTIADLQELLNGILLDIKADYKDYEDVRAEDAAQKALDAAKKAVEDAIAAVEKEGTYTSPLKADELKAQIEKLLADAKDAKAKADAEAKRQADNKAAYEADLQKISDLESLLNNTIVDIQADYKDYEDVRAEQAVKDAIAAAKKAVEEAYKAVAESGNYAGTVDVEGLTAKINKLLDDAKAAKEAARKAANDAAYNNDLNKLKEIEDYLKDALNTIDTEYPIGKNEEENQKVKDAVEAAKKAVEDAKKAVENEGNYESPLDADALKKMIDDLVANAKTNGINSVYADADGNEPVIYTIDGVRHTEPVKGHLNIMVYPDGTAKKVLVK